MRFALVHGAWHGAWAWDALIPELEARATASSPRDLPCEDVNAGAADYRQVIIDALDGSDDVMVVGHSLGGMTVPLVPARMHVYWFAYDPQPGRALIDRGFGGVRGRIRRLGCPRRARALLLARRGGRRPRRAISGRARDPGRQAASTGTETQRRAEPAPRPFGHCMCIRRVRRGLRRPASWQRHVAHTELGVQPTELDSGHSPMLTCPAELAEVLDRLAVNVRVHQT